MLRIGGCTDHDEALQALKQRYFAEVVLPLRRSYAWGIPTEEALRCIADHSPLGVVEIGAGTGYWASLLSQPPHSLSVAAYDKTPMVDRTAPLEGYDRKSALNGYHALATMGNALPFCNVEAGGPEAAAAHPDRSLLLCWPPKEASANGEPTGEDGMMAFDALSHYAGDTVLYVGCFGGGDGGRLDTAGGRFEDRLQEDFERVHMLPLPHWPQVRDTLTVWRRRGATVAATRGGEARAREVPLASAGVGAAKAAGVEAPAANTPPSGLDPALDMTLDRYVREQSLAQLRSGLDASLLQAALWRRWRGALSGTRPVVSEVEARMLERCVERAPTWTQRAIAVVDALLGRAGA